MEREKKKRRKTSSTRPPRHGETRHFPFIAFVCAPLKYVPPHVPLLERGRFGRNIFFRHSRAFARGPGRERTYLRGFLAFFTSCWLVILHCAGERVRTLKAFSVKCHPAHDSRDTLRHIIGRT